MSFFGVSGVSLGGNPFSTPVGQRIEIATDENLPSENWELNMEICDLINNTDEGPRDAVKAIRKRLQQNAGKNYTVVMYTLTVLETCVKNCGKRFHLLVCSKDFVQDLVKLIGPKNDPPTVVQEKVLSLIQSWADAFSGQPDLSGVCTVVSDLRAKGIEFPPTDLDTMAPIHTPHRSVTTTEPCSEVIVPNITGGTTNQGGGDVPDAPAPINAILAPEQIGKLQSELDVVQNNMSVLSEMLAEMTPGKEDPSDLELLQELYSTCRAMQSRLVELIGKLANDELTAELLRINDEMNNLFLRYARYEKNREAGNRGTPSALLGAALGVNKKTEQAQDALIDLSDEASTGKGVLEDEFSALSVRSTNGKKDIKLSEISSVPAQKGAIEKDDEFDMFAQSRNVSYESSKLGGSTYKDNLEPDQVSGSLSSLAQSRTQPPTVPGRERDFDEMAAWLESTPGNRENISAAGGEESVTSSEFERFLAERAAAAESLPTAAGTTTNTNTTSASQQQQQRRKDDDAGLFAL